MSAAVSCDQDEAARAASHDLVAALLARGLRVVTAESLTGGLASYLLVREPDSGQVMAGSVVTYLADEKRRVLGVGDYPVVSAECARQMAAGASQLFETPCAIAFTGVAGPAAQEGRPVGTVFIAARCREHSIELERRFDGDPDAIRLAAITAGFQALRQLVESSSP